MRGNTLQVLVKHDQTYYPVAYCTGQKISVSNQTADTTTKSEGKVKEITGRSWTISTENLVVENGSVNFDAAKILNECLCKDILLPIQIKAGDVVVLEGQARLVKFDMNFPNKENSTFSAEWQGYGKYTVPSSVATQSED